ncbi:MAG: c-type cytochrome [Gammaproteobacteria bacterium]|nr:c-type cytochrome [Gammaproteobacteria bacterium]
MKYQTILAILFAAIAFCLSGTALATPAEKPVPWNWPEEPENLKVLTQLKGQRLAPVMTGFTRALGVRCTHCHVGVDGESFHDYDFASDEKLAKRTARRMLEMLGDINSHLDEVEHSGPEPVNMWCDTCHRGRPRPLRLHDELAEVYVASGKDAALAHYEELRERFYGRGAYDFGPNALNSFGYQVLGDGDIDGAVDIFERNVALHPDNGNAHDSLGEGYMKQGRTAAAIESYERALQLNPRNDNARQQLEVLRQAR